jgi:threonine dehydratase
MNPDAEGLATAHGYEFPQSILRDELNDFVLIEEDEIDASVALFLEHTHTLVEGASATSLAAALSLKDSLQGKRVVIVATGANLSMDQLDRVISGRGR